MPPSAHVVASWQRDAVHIWGWDGTQTMPPFWLSGGFPRSGRIGSPASYGFHSSLDVVAPSGERLRPVSVRLDAVAGLDWLRAMPVVSDSARWFGTLAELAAQVVEAGAVVPALTTTADHGLGDASNVVAEAHWAPTAGASVDAVLDALAEAMPPICLPGVAPDDTVSRRSVAGTIFERFVDNVARAQPDASGMGADRPAHPFGDDRGGAAGVSCPHRPGRPRPGHPRRARRCARSRFGDPPAPRPPGPVANRC